MNQKLLHFGLDYVRFNVFVDHKDFDLFFIGKSDNSNYGNHEFCGQIFSSLWSNSKFGDQVMLIDSSSSVVRVEKIKDWGVIKNCYYRVDFYGSFFGFDYSDKLLSEFVKRYSSIIDLSRLDICSDWANISPKGFLDMGYKTNFRISDTVKESQDGEFQTKYFGSKSVAQNPRHFFRIYDKKKDIGYKNKTLHYLDYLSYNLVTRCEVQINKKSIQSYGVTSECLLSESRLLNIYTSLSYNPDSTMFSALYRLCGFSGGVIIPKRYHAEQADLTDELAKTRYASVFLAYGQNLHDKGFDIFSFLDKNIKK